MSNPIFAQSHGSSNVAADFEKLKNHPQNYSTFGVICEEVARLRLEELYGQTDYDFSIGIAYTGDGRTLGELDVIIFRKSDQEAVVVAEVKCWKKLTAALTKANKQIIRFRRNLATDNIDSMESTSSEGQTYRPDQFDERPNFMTISQSGGVAAGFDMDIGLTLREAKRLRRMLIRCQEQGKCPTAI